MIRILVTGGFGFIGATLSELLVRDPSSSVHVVDDLSTSPVNLKDYLNQIGNPSNLTYDICTVEDYFSRNKVPKFDEVYHLASPVGPAGVLNFAGDLVRIITQDFYLLMDYCIETGAKLLDVSTSEIYGGGVEGYCPEDTARIVPPTTTVRLEYAMGKLAAETALINSCRTKKLNASIVRPFNVAGPRQSPEGGFVVPRFIQQADAGIPLTVFGDGSAIRAFTHVEDISQGIILSLRKGKSGEAYNIGNPEPEISMLDLVERIEDVLGRKLERNTNEYPDSYPADEPMRRSPDITKARRQLGFAPAVSLEDGLGRFLHWADGVYTGKL